MPTPAKKTIQQTLILTDKTRARKAIQWFYSMAATKLKRNHIPDEAFGVKRNNKVFIGGLFIYQYDPKMKETLPWYDTLPCVIPVSLTKDGWIGLNVHYLPPMLRAKLMDKLISYRKKAMSEKAYMRVSYHLLQAAVKSKLFAPCIHRYLATHVTTRLIQINDEYWEDVAMLPLQQFEKRSAQSVWRTTGRS